MMSALGEREQILGALGREGTAGAPVPMAAEPPQPPAGSLLPSQPSPTACPHPRACRGSGARQGHGHPHPTPLQPAASPSTGNHTPAGGSRSSVLCQQRGVPAPHQAPQEQPLCSSTGG